MKNKQAKIKQNTEILALKIKTEGNGLGVLKTFIVLILIALQLAFFIFSYYSFLHVFKWYFVLSIILSLICAIHVLSSDFHGQVKAVWVLFLLSCFGFAYVFYFFSNKSMFFAKSKKKYGKILDSCTPLNKQNNNVKVERDTENICNYLYNVGKFFTYNNCKLNYYSSGNSMFDDVIESIQKAKHFIFMEFFIVSDGILLDKIYDILKDKVKQGVQVKIIYDDMGSHKTLKRRTKKKFAKAGITMLEFNRLVPVLNFALNLRDHRKIVVIDGEVGYTGGVNLADEYTNAKRMHGYWKDSGIKIEGQGVDNFTIAFLNQWEMLTNKKIDYDRYINRAKVYENNSIVVPFVSGPNYPFSISQNMFAEVISKANEKLYIMTPYFIPDETITNLIINKAKSGIDVRIILPDVADKKFVYVVSRNNVEKMMKYGVKLYTMTSSFVHSKIVATEKMVIVGSINMDLRSFYQQFESAIFTNDTKILEQVNADFNKTFKYSRLITDKEKKRNSRLYRILAGTFNIVSPFM